MRSTPLQHKIQIEAEFQLSNHNDRRIVATKSDKVTAADFTLHLKSEGLEEPFYGQIKRSLQDTSSSWSRKLIPMGPSRCTCRCLLRTEWSGV